MALEQEQKEIKEQTRNYPKPEHNESDGKGRNKGLPGSEVETPQENKKRGRMQE